MVDTTPREWAPEQAQTIRTDVRRLFWRRTGPQLAVFTAGWCVLAAVVAFATAMPTGIAVALAAAGVCAVAAGEIRISDLTFQEAFLPWLIGALAGFPMVVGLIFKETIPMVIGLVILGVGSVMSVIACVRSYRRLIPR